MVAGCLGILEGITRTEPTPCEGIDDPVTGEGKSISIEKTVSDEDIQYLTEEDAVDVGHDTYDFEWWAKGRTANIGAEHTSEVITNRLSGDPYWGSVLVHRRTTIQAALEYWYDRGGDPISIPDVDFKQLVTVAPPHASVTIHLADQTYHRQVPIQVVCKAIQQT